MHLVLQLLSFVSPRPEPAGDIGRAQRLVLSVFAFLVSLVFAALWGVAAGSHGGHVALGNAVTVPLLLVVSSLTALPVGILVFRLTAPVGRSTDLVLAHAVATFTGTLVLALLSPIVALYQHSSAWAGPSVALGSAIVALMVGFAILLRALTKLVPSGGRRSFAAPVGLLLVMQMAALMQLASISAPIFDARTPFGRGIDALHPTPSAALDP